LLAKLKNIHLSIDCNDEGVLHLEAYANCHLVDYLRQLSLGSLEKLVPQEITSKELIPGDYISMIKVTSFACGAIAIGVLVSRMITDGIALSVFLKGWAATARKA
jgi:shikimate O-hydroxycinnamoyltransferase